jgi:hypothetical protein
LTCFEEVPDGSAKEAAMVLIHGTTPYAGVKPTSGERSVLVVLLEAYDGDDPRFNTYYATSQEGDLYEVVVEVSREDGAIIKLEGQQNISELPVTSPGIRRSPYRPAVGFSPTARQLVSLYATGSDGVVYSTFYDRLAGVELLKHPWRQWGTLPGGIAANSAPSVVNSPDGSMALAFVTASDWEVYQSVLVRGSGNPWSPWKPLHLKNVKGGTAVMNSVAGDYLSVFVIGPTGRAVESTYIRGVSQWAQKLLPAGPALTGRPACSAAANGTLESVFALGVDGVVYQTIRSPKPSSPWSSWTALPSNVKLSGSPSVLDAYNGNSLSVVSVDTAGRLMRCRYVRGYASGSTDHWTAWELVPMWAGAPRWRGATQITTPATAEPAESYRELFFGPGRSLRNYCREVSGGRFTIREAGVVGWLRPSKALKVLPNLKHLSDADLCSWDFVHDSDKYDLSLEKKSAWVIAAAEIIGGFRYADYARGASGRVILDDLAVVWVYGCGSGGAVRGVDPRVVKVPSLTGGVSQEYGLPRFGPRLSLRLAAEEVAHSLLGIVDLYASSANINPLTEPLALAITGTGGESPHLSPWDKMKLGWCTGKVAKQSGWYELHAVEKDNEVLILQTGSADEYFILENRYPPGSFEDDFKGQGLAVWHIVEKSASGPDNWGRDTIRLLHCQPVSPTADRGETFLWDGSNPNQSYDLTDGSTPSNLRLAGGTPSGLRIQSISAAGSIMRFHVTLPQPAGN